MRGPIKPAPDGEHNDYVADPEDGGFWIERDPFVIYVYSPHDDKEGIIVEVFDAHENVNYELPLETIYIKG
jgi:hypothetical protein